VLADVLGLYLLPGVSALLPWRVGYALLKRAARVEWFHREVTDAAWRAARQVDGEWDEVAWKTGFRLLRMVDHADSYLTILRSGGWWRSRIDVDGTWPAPTDRGHLFLTYHWGAGHWIWRLLRARGFEAAFLARRVEGRDLGATRLSHWYARFRAWALSRIGSRGAIFTGQSTGVVRDALASGTSIVGMLDLPASARQRTVRVQLLGRAADLPAGLVHIAVDAGCAVTVFSAGLDLATGRRRLHLELAPPGCGVAEIMNLYASHLDTCLRARPEFWQLWCVAPALFAPHADAEARQAL